ncbi:hypothetical protein AAES_113500 [Amazona aestiva]|uniref:Uncharacterized protein n=1 Tax=Amazona aestiva TaxID=12930 RepID=A0A0Q3M8N9_AMAAE|nr:hypothetical protein AAES_113500 [Amazona aestiva]
MAKVFLLALSLAFVGKTMSGAYMNSLFTQLERQFNIPASLVGIINGSFEIECEKEPGSLLWIFVMVGNIVRGMGETPIMPLGISYLEDFAKAENSPFYLGCLHTATVIGPFLGLLLASFCAELFVDLGSVDADFIPFLKALLHNPVYMLFICITVLQFNAFNGMLSFMPKYVEQQFGKSASDAIFLIGVYNLPVICVGYFFGGLLMKKFKTNIYQAAKIAFWVSLLEYLLYFGAYWTICNTSPVAGLTVSYEGSLTPEEKSFGVGIHGLASRVFGVFLTMCVHVLGIASCPCGINDKINFIPWSRKSVPEFKEFTQFALGDGAEHVEGEQKKRQV